MGGIYETGYYFMWIVVIIIFGEEFGCLWYNTRKALDFDELFIYLSIYLFPQNVWDGGGFPPSFSFLLDLLEGVWGLGFFFFGK